jgi:hypothetical protein
MKNTGFGIFVCLAVLWCTAPAQNAPPQPAFGTFAFTDTVRLAGTPAAVYDAITGDVTGWWDHSFSKHPYKMYIEPKPGGGFYEIFSADGDGVLHATVTAAHRGVLLRFVGPLGLAGRAVEMVTTWNFTASEKDSTMLVIAVSAAGDVNEGLGKLVRGVWHHFLVERFIPYWDNKRSTTKSQ